jgi:hypothetical protein
MQKLSVVISTVCLLSLLAACAGSQPASTPEGDADLVATIVAGTLTAYLTDTPVPVAVTPIATVSPVVPTPIPMTRCEGPVTGVTVSVPSDTWSCEIKSYGDVSSGYDALSLVSPLFTVSISTLGRGSTCGGEEPLQGIQDPASCVVTPFYENEYLSLSTYSTYGKTREIFGLIPTIKVNQNTMWVSVQYVGMEERELTQTEKQELVAVLDTIRPASGSSPVDDRWAWQDIELYSLRLNLPPGWSISETNRRPEPTGEFDPVKGHDCAEYLVTSPDGLSILTLRPTCGASEGMPSAMPPDTVIINPDSNDWIGRYSTAGKYMYTKAEILSYEDLTGMHQENACFYPPAVIIKKGDVFLAIGVDLQYQGNPDQLTQALETADAIVESITIQ